MAAKWADYVITAVRFNIAGTHIDSVQTYKHDGTQLTGLTTRSRSQVVQLIEGGSSVCTATKGTNGLYSYGAEVKVVVIEGEKYIRTKSDGTKKDNLDNLPTF